MSPPEDITRLRHILDHATEAVEMARDRARADLQTDRQFGLAMTRLLEIVGEAAARVTPETRARIPDVPWPQIVALRNRLIHGYDDVDFDVLWVIVTADLPPLVSAVRGFLESP